MNNTATRLVTSFHTPSALLRRALLADATLTSVAGIVLVLAAKPLGELLNALWALDSVLLVLTRWVETTPIGEFFVIGQALVVAAIAEVEFIGLRRSTLVESYARH